MKRICWDRPDTGCVERIRPSEHLRRVAEPEDDVLGRMALVLLPGGAPFILKDDDDAEFADRTYRNAWKLSGGTIDHDMPKARALHKALAVAAGRNIPDATLNAAKTPAELKLL